MITLHSSTPNKLRMASILRLTIVLLACAGIEMVLAEHNLTIMLITSFGEFGFDSSGAIPAADVALDDINGNNSMLPGYKLVYDEPRNSQVLDFIIHTACMHIHYKVLLLIKTECLLSNLIYTWLLKGVTVTFSSRSNISIATKIKGATQTSMQTSLFIPLFYCEDSFIRV